MAVETGKMQEDSHFVYSLSIWIIMKGKPSMFFQLENEHRNIFFTHLRVRLLWLFHNKLNEDLWSKCKGKVLFCHNSVQWKPFAPLQNIELMEKKY